MSACDHNSNIRPQVALHIDAGLGEGALWHHETARLWWVDIEKGLLHIFDPSETHNTTIDMGQRIGTVVPCPDTRNAIVALQDGIYALDLQSGALTLMVSPESGLDGQRFNDGKCDPQGRFWVGSLSMHGEEGASALYRVDADGSARKMIGNVSVSNGITWSADGRTMYYIDTPTREVAAYDFDPASGNIANKRVVVRVEEDMGMPDGMTIDEEGKLWIAHWGGYGVYRWDPETGTCLEKVAVPAKQVTSCAFGGKDLDVLYITTARVGLDEAELEQYPRSGCLFYVRPGVRGVRSFAFAGCP